MAHQQPLLPQLTLWALALLCGVGIGVARAEDAPTASFSAPAPEPAPEPESGSAPASGPSPIEAHAAPEAPVAPEEEPLRRWGALFGLGAPQLAEIGVSYRRSPRWDFFLEGGYVPLPISANGTLVGLDLEAGTQFHFFSSAFFGGLSLGYQRLSYDTSVDFSSFGTDLGAQPSSLRIQSFYLEPCVGFLWRKSSGFLIGFDVGVAIPVLGSGRLDVSGGSSMASSVGSASEAPLSYFASLIMPRIHLIRLGWVF